MAYRALLVCFCFFLAFSLTACGNRVAKPQNVSSQKQTSKYIDAPKILKAFHNKQSNLWIESTGVVERLLDDDLKGSRHQRFIVRLVNSQTLLISHNIDLAPRIDSLKSGDRVNFRGEYEYNDKGGVVHWTHHDPSRKLLGGWIDHGGLRYR